MTKKHLFFFSFILIMFPAKAQISASVSWFQYEALRTENPKPTLVFVHTDWCSFCKIQEKNIGKSPELIQLLKEKVYFLDLNAEKEKQSIVFFGREYNFIQNGTSGLHELALKLAPHGQRPAYPLWVLLDTEGKIVFRYEGLLKNNKLRKILETL